MRGRELTVDLQDLVHLGHVDTNTAHGMLDIDPSLACRPKVMCVRYAHRPQVILQTRSARVRHDGHLVLPRDVHNLDHILRGQWKHDDSRWYGYPERNVSKRRVARDWSRLTRLEVDSKRHSMLLEYRLIRRNSFSGERYPQLLDGLREIFMRTVLVVKLDMSLCWFC